MILSAVVRLLFFTFHDVSINTPTNFVFLSSGYPFTFHDVSINTGRAKFYPAKFLSLHSTMFLLIPSRSSCFLRGLCSLHSTMFLLIPKLSKEYEFPELTFTFHDVSINTLFSVCNFNSYGVFTFHDVSINTEQRSDRGHDQRNFTFHDVSINTRRLFILTIRI